MKSNNQIVNYLQTIREFIKTGGWCGDDKYYSYICITYKNGEEEFIQQDNIELGDIPCLVASKIKQIEAWWSGGPNSTPIEEIITKDNYWASR